MSKLIPDQYAVILTTRNTNKLLRIVDSVDAALAFIYPREELHPIILKWHKTKRGKKPEFRIYRLVSSPL